MHKINKKNSNQIRVAVVEDHTVVRQALVMLLKREPQVVVCFQAENGQDFLNQLPIHQIDVVLLDLDMPVMDGRATLHHLKQNHPTIKVILLSMHEDPWMVSELIKEGAHCYLKKNCSFDELVDALFGVKFNGTHVTPLMKTALENVDQLHSPSEAITLKHQLSVRESLVLTLICDGKTSEQIAAKMHLSKKSIDAIRSSILKLIGARNPAELVRKSVLLGLYKLRTDEQILEDEIQQLEAKKRNRNIKSEK